MVRSPSRLLDDREERSMAKKSDPVVTEAERAQRRADAKLMSKPAQPVPHEPEHVTEETSAAAAASVSSPGTVSSDPSEPGDERPKAKAKRQKP